MGPPTRSRHICPVIVQPNDIFLCPRGSSRLVSKVSHFEQLWGVSTNKQMDFGIFIKLLDLVHDIVEVRKSPRHLRRWYLVFIARDAVSFDEGRQF